MKDICCFPILLKPKEYLGIDWKKCNCRVIKTIEVFINCSVVFEKEIYKYLTTFKFVFNSIVAYEKEIYICI